MYADSPPPCQQAIFKFASGLAGALGPTNPAFLDMVQSHPDAARPLIMHMVQELCTKAAPPPPLRDACRQLFARTSNPQVRSRLNFTRVPFLIDHPRRIAVLFDLDLLPCFCLGSFLHTTPTGYCAWIPTICFVLISLFVWGK